MKTGENSMHDKSMFKLFTREGCYSNALEISICGQIFSEEGWQSNAYLKGLVSSWFYFFEVVNGVTYLF